jgi:hypothetical protein
MIEVSFKFDPETKKVSDVIVIEAGVKTPAKTVAKTKTKGNTKIVLNGNSLQLNQEVVDLLCVGPGDRLCVRFDPKPVLVRPDIANELKGGNLITKSLTVSVKGKTGETLKEYGTEFEYTLKSEGYVTLATDGDTLEDKPVQEISTTLDDSEFIANIENGEEIDFQFEI